MPHCVNFLSCRPQAGVEYRVAHSGIRRRKVLHMHCKILTVVLGAVLGTLVNFSSVFVVSWAIPALIFGEHLDAQWGMGIVVLMVILGSLGMISGLIGGFFYSNGQRFVTAASPCLGLLVGGTILQMGIRIASSYPWLNSLMLASMAAPLVGGALGVSYAVRTSPSRQSSRPEFRGPTRTRLNGPCTSWCLAFMRARARGRLTEQPSGVGLTRASEITVPSTAISTSPSYHVSWRPPEGSRHKSRRGMSPPSCRAGGLAAVADLADRALPNVPVLPL